MERRTSFPPTGDTVLRVLSDSSATPIPGKITAVAEGFVRVQLSHAIPLDAAVRLDVLEGMVLAEVVDCRPCGEGHEVHMCIDQVIPSVPDLAKLVNAVMNWGAPQKPRATEPCQTRRR